MIKRLIKVSLTMLMCVALFASLTGCSCGEGEGTFGLSHDEMALAGLTETDLQELHESMSEEEWNVFIKEIHEAYATYKRENKEQEEAKPEKVSKAREPVEMFPEQFPGYCPDYPPWRESFLFPYENVVAGARASYRATEDGGCGDIVRCLHAGIIEFTDDGAAIDWFCHEVVSGGTRIEPVPGPDSPYEVDVLVSYSEDKAVIASATKDVERRFDGAIFKGIFYHYYYNYTCVRLHGKYAVILEQSGGMVVETAMAYPDDIDKIFERAYHAIKF